MFLKLKKIINTYLANNIYANHDRLIISYKKYQDEFLYCKFTSFKNSSEYNFYSHPIFYVNLKNKKILLKEDPNIDLNMKTHFSYLSRYLHNFYLNDRAIYLSPICFVKNRKELIWYLEQGVDINNISQPNLSLFYILYISLPNNRKKFEILKELLNRNIFCDLHDPKYFNYYLYGLLFVDKPNKEIFNMVLKYIYFHYNDIFQTINEYIIAHLNNKCNLEFLLKYVKLYSTKIYNYSNLDPKFKNIVENKFIDQMVNINKCDELFFAIYNNNITQVKKILKTGNYKIRDALGYNLYHYCFDQKILELLFNENLDLPLLNKGYPLPYPLFEKEKLLKGNDKKISSISQSSNNTYIIPTII